MLETKIFLVLQSGLAYLDSVLNDKSPADWSGEESGMT